MVANQPSTSSAAGRARASLAFPLPGKILGALVPGLLCGILVTAPGCGGDSGGGTPPEAAVASSALRRDDRPEAVEARQLLDQGRADLALPLIEAVAPSLGVEGPLLRARMAALTGDTAEWLRLVEEARSMDPLDPRPYAVAAELYAAIGRMDAAKAEIKRGIESAKSVTPELQRAQGVVAIVTPGGGRIGLQLLEAARRADPGIPFMGRPLGQAYLLSAKRALAEGQAELALERIVASIAHDPEDRDARRMHGEVLIGVNQDFERGLEILEALLADGEPIRDVVGEMQWKAGLSAQFAGRGDAARGHYLRARELGALDVRRGTAATFLRGESTAAFERAAAAAESGDAERARLQLAEAAALSEDAADARHGHALALAARAQSALKEQRFDAAQGLIGAAHHSDPTMKGVSEVASTLYFMKAVEAMKVGDASGAITFAREATVQDPTDAIAHQLVGELSYTSGNYKEAARALDRAISNAELDGEPLELEVMLMLAESQHLAGSKQDAIATLEQCVRDTRPAAAEEKARARRYLDMLRGGEGG